MSADSRKYAVIDRSAPRAAAHTRRLPLLWSLQKRPCNEITERRKASGGAEAVLSPEKGLQVLCRAHRYHQLQRREAAVAVRSGTREDHAAPHIRRLLPAPAP